MFPWKHQTLLTAKKDAQRSAKTPSSQTANTATEGMPVIIVQTQSATGTREFAKSETAAQLPRSGRFSTKLTPDLSC